MTCALFLQYAIQKLFGSCAQQFCFDQGILLVKSIQECVGTTHNKRNIPEQLCFFLSSLDEIRLSRRLRTRRAPCKEFKSEHKQNTFNNQVPILVHPRKLQSARDFSISRPVEQPLHITKELGATNGLDIPNGVGSGLRVLLCGLTMSFLDMLLVLQLNSVEETA
jgi:hypothetical protein